MAFALHAQLHQDCHRLGSLAASELLLQRNATLPWFLLVPRVAAFELFELAPDVRAGLTLETDQLARFIKTRFDCDKINVAAIGNVVGQLHVHVIGRRHSDPCWPGVVWGRLPPGADYSPAEIAQLQQDLAANRTLQFSGDRSQDIAVAPVS